MSVPVHLDEWFWWAAALVLVAVALWALARWLLGLTRALVAMWPPLVVTAAAAFFLLANDQGQELGVSLMESPGINLASARLGALFLVLVYWGLSNWHAARLGLERLYVAQAAQRGVATQVVINDSRWAFWAPRVVGVCAHLLAALNLTLAARIQPEFLPHKDEALLGWLPWTAPAAIVAATALVWAVDYRALSRRRAARPYKKLAGWVFLGSVLIEASLLALLLSAFWPGKIPAGFFGGTIIIFLSAVAFLLLVGYLRRARPDGTDESRGLTRWTLALAAPAPLAVILAAFWPVDVGWMFGSLVVAIFAFAAVLAVVTFCGLAATWAANRLRPRWAGANAHAVVAFALLGLFGLAVLTSIIRPFHRVRLCEKEDACAKAPAPHMSDGEKWSALAAPQDRLTVAEAAVAWYHQARKAYAPGHPGSPVPMLVVATAGGGIRAAVWTAAALDRLEGDLKGDKEGSIGLRPLLFAISGVSGGSVGATFYLAGVAAHEADPKTPIESLKQLSRDFLAPGLLSWIFVDGPSNVLPEFEAGDRGVALETGFERASDHALAAAFLSFFPDKATAEAHWRPILLLNATHQETGRRLIASNVKVERQVFEDAYDQLQVLGADMRASTAAHNSARFTYVSPAGDLIPTPAVRKNEGLNRGYVIDGGYFENYGAAAALEISREAMRAIRKECANNNDQACVRRVILLISSDPTLDRERARVRLREAHDEGGGMKCGLSTAMPATKDEAAGGNFLPFKGPSKDGSQKNDGEGFILSSYNELTAPLLGVMSVRQAHGVRAAEELAGEICAEQPVGAGTPKATATAEAVSQTLAAAANTGFQTAEPWPANDKNSFFAHLAMCGKENDDPPPANPPLGWVLSTATHDAIAKFTDYCGNGDEIASLEKALGVK